VIPHSASDEKASIQYQRSEGGGLTSVYQGKKRDKGKVPANFHPGKRKSFGDLGQQRVKRRENQFIPLKERKVTGGQFPDRDIDKRLQ